MNPKSAQSLRGLIWYMVNPKSAQSLRGLIWYMVIPKSALSLTGLIWDRVNPKLAQLENYIVREGRFSGEMAGFCGTGLIWESLLQTFICHPWSPPFSYYPSHVHGGCLILANHQTFLGGQLSLTAR